MEVMGTALPSLSFGLPCWKVLSRLSEFCRLKFDDITEAAATAFKDFKGQHLIS